MIVTVAHLRSVPAFGRGAGFCARGSRAWFARHGLSWKDFVNHGIDHKTLTATGDALALALVAHAHAQQGNAHGQ